MGIKADIIPSFLYLNDYTAVNSGKEGKKHMAEEFKSINTQEDFDARIKERLERAEKAVKKSFDGWTSPDDLKAIQAKHEEELKKLNDTHAEELKKYSGYDEKFAEQQNEIKSLKIDAMKTNIANEKNLPFDAIGFLQGDDEQSIAESADRLAKLSNASHSIGFTRNTEETQGDATDNAFRDLAKRFSKN